MFNKIIVRPYKKYLPVALIFLALILFFSLRLYEYLNLKCLEQHQHQFQKWTIQHYVMASSIYMLLYALAIAATIPGTTLLALAGGFLFGIWYGTAYIVISTSLGATCFFLAVRSALSDQLANKSRAWIIKLENNFKQNPFKSVLMLRLLPVVPSWLVNVASGVFEVRTFTFIIATFIGIIPITFFYAAVGNHLEQRVTMSSWEAVRHTSGQVLPFSYEY